MRQEDICRSIRERAEGFPLVGLLIDVTRVTVVGEDTTLLAMVGLALLRAGASVPLVVRRVILSVDNCW